MKSLMIVRADELEVGDNLLHLGVVKARMTFGEGQTTFAYESQSDGELQLSRSPNNLMWNIEREVEDPQQEFELETIFGKRVVVGPADDNGCVKIGIEVGMATDMTWGHIQADALVSAITKANAAF